VTKISYPTTVDRLLQSTDHLLVVAPRAVFRAARFPVRLPEKAAGLLRELSDGLEPGNLGTTATTLASGSPKRLTVGVLPDEVSRYDSPARAEAIRKVTKEAALARVRDRGFLLILDEPGHLLAAVNAIGRALPLYTRKTSAAQRSSVRVLATDRRGKTLPPDRALRETVDAARHAARLVDMPPTELDPRALAQQARAMLRGVPNVRIKQIVGQKLLTAKLCGVHAVGRCATTAPRVLLATYTPPRPHSRVLALVGKGITYDTGGLHLKARGAMESMKGDMGGAAAALGAFRVLALTRCPLRLHLVLCLAENAIGPRAYKPDDVLTLHSGRTVEINNTDAEGRILLADGASYAARVLKADTILDAATLTGAQLIATGLLHAAVISNDPALESAMVAAGTATGDLVHPLPFAPAFYKQEFESPIADMRNSVKDRSNAQTSCAAQFIHWHIEDTPARWAHVDLAGPAWRFDRGTGYGVALLAEAVRRLA
jgi:probable aminopeptidase NPEPL1